VMSAVPLISSLIAACRGSPTSPSKVQPSPLIGEWILVSSDRRGNPSGIGVRRKVFTQTAWSITQRDPTTGEIVFHHGGTYTLNGSADKETVEFANASTASLIGQTFTYQVTIQGDTYSQADGPFNEVWKRA
jgi:hypothetical protein